MAYKPYFQADNNEEILSRDSPLTRYGEGVLYPQPTREVQSAKSAPSDPIKRVVFDDFGEEVFRETKFGEPDKSDSCVSSATAYDDTGSLDLSGAIKPLPRSMGVTFLVRTAKKTQLIVDVSGGRYHPLLVKIGKDNRKFWKREKVELTFKFNKLESICTPQKIKGSIARSINAEGLNLSVEAYARPTKNSNQLLITVVLVNRTETPVGKMADGYALFQAGFSARVVSPALGSKMILPYPPNEEKQVMSNEERSIDLLYRHARTYAIGHGCAADWDKRVGEDEKVREVVASCFPTYEVPHVTSEVKRADGTLLEISMSKLAGLIPGDDGMRDLAEMVDAYEHWIKRRVTKLAPLEARYHYAGHRHLTECGDALARMRDGLKLLQENPRAKRAFELANHAILMQQHRSKLLLRETIIDTKTKEPVFARKNTNPDPLDSGRGKWRAFQIAFLLLSMRSAIDPECAERETVDLIFFPTGGGKTESYLSLSAFTIFYRRLLNPADAGTTVFMRYTLRLLTAQMFQRTSALICAMEMLRRENPKELGATEISIGLWLGNEITPGTRNDAMRDYDRLVANPQSTENKFILNRCPHCAAEIGKIKVRSEKNKNEHQYYIRGYKKERGRVVLHCPDSSCDFHDRLPIYVVDEDVYEKRPSFVIGTVDKLGILAFKPAARALFGLGKDGERIFSPPTLKVQDELHLISGPLGTMVALYEPLIEDLCTDRRAGREYRPKIIAATATTRAYPEQIRSLYARDDARLFPPPGLDAGNCFFARYARDENGDLLPGRLYVGINAPGLGSSQSTEVRVYTALSQSVGNLPAPERDHYWSMMLFFTNLKSLGNSLTLLQANVKSYFRTYKNRTNQTKSRFLNRTIELTGQLRGDEVLTALKKLEVNYGETNNHAVDVCLCSSVIEVGMDVSRLSLMSIVSQPKTAAQYIQASSRVGRDAAHPGLVTVIYNPSNARDRSHFERFRSFHERLYAQVEPVSATPFSPPALERALHAVMVAYIRQTGTYRQSVTPFPVPEAEISRFKNLMLARLQKNAPEMREGFERIFNRRVDQLRRWEHTSWSEDRQFGYESGLLRMFDKWVTEEVKARSWATPVSMRTVDTECEMRITHFYQTLTSEKV
jgi:Helicase conserved C-terminal domain